MQKVKVYYGSNKSPFNIQIEIEEMILQGWEVVSMANFRDDVLFVVYSKRKEI